MKASTSARGCDRRRSAGDVGLHLFEILQRHAARLRNTFPIRHQALGNALAVRDELPADGLGVEHASVLVGLGVGHGSARRECQAKKWQRNC